MKTAIIIPARFGSTRFPGKPLAMIGGKTMLARVAEIGRKAANKFENVDLMVATEDERIANHAKELGVSCVMTSGDCATGSDRILEAAQKSGKTYDHILGLQGDAPFTPLEAIEKMLSALATNPETEVVTPVVRLRWSELDALREDKKKTPFSGTTVIIAHNGKALWFSKNIIPAIRGEDMLRAKPELYSPIHQHLGLYGYRRDVLERFVSLPQGHYEQLEGLEQLRLLENGISIQTVTVQTPLGLAQAGVDSPEDLRRAEMVLAKYGEPE